MSHSVIDGIANSIVTVLLISLVAQVDVDKISSDIGRLARDEQRIKVCGSIEAGLKNFDDVVGSGPNNQRKRLKVGLQYVADQLNQAIERSLLPGPEDCQIQTNGPFKYNYDVYRLDEIDSSNRRVNWAYRFAALEEI